MHLYYRTSSTAAAAVLTHGFRDGWVQPVQAGWRHYLMERPGYGVWLADSPDTTTQVSTGDIVLRVEFAVPALHLTACAWTDPATGQRAYLLPAELINQHAAVVQLSATTRSLAAAG